MTNERIWLVHKKNNYQNCKDENNCLTRKNFPEVTIDGVVYNSPLDLALQLNEIDDLKNRLNKDYVYTDYNLALKEANRLKAES